jgi:hypothetical protein
MEEESLSDIGAIAGDQMAPAKEHFGNLPGRAATEKVEWDRMGS